MPTYEYECKTCGTVFDYFQSIKARPLRSAECAHCGRVRPVRRLISAGGGLLFKGGGFYKTDYRSESYQKSAKSETGTPSGEGQKDGGSLPLPSGEGRGEGQATTTPAQDASKSKPSKAQVASKAAKDKP